MTQEDSKYVELNKIAAIEFLRNVNESQLILNNWREIINKIFKDGIPENIDEIKNLALGVKNVKN